MGFNSNPVLIRRSSHEWHTSISCPRLVGHDDIVVTTVELAQTAHNTIGCVSDQCLSEPYYSGWK